MKCFIFIKLGRKTEKTKTTLAESLTGRKASAEQIRHQSEAQKGVPKLPRTAEHIRNNANAVRAYWAAKRAQSC